jgi:hypothetical protein
LQACQLAPANTGQRQHGYHIAVPTSRQTAASCIFHRLTYTICSQKRCR